MEMWNQVLEITFKTENWKKITLFEKKDQEVCDTHMITCVGDCGQWDVRGDFGPGLHTSHV